MKPLIKRERAKISLIFAMTAILLSLVGILIVNNVIVPQREYNKSVELMEKELPV